MKSKSVMRICCLLLGATLTPIFIATPCAGSTEGPGSTGASYLTLPVSPRSIAMGEAGAALENPYSLFYNPALIGSDGRKGIGVSHSEWIIDTRYETVSASAPFQGKLAVGAGITYLYRPEIQGYDQLGPTNEEYKSNNYQVMFGFKFSPAPFLSAGLGFKHFRENLGQWHAEGMAVDMGLLFSIEEFGTSIGLSVQNIGPDIKFRRLDEPIPLTVRVGGSQAFNIVKFRTTFTIAADAVKPRYEDVYISAGAEVRFQEILCVRAGYCGEKHRPGDGFSMGGGVYVRDYIQLDYAYSPYGKLGDFHRISMYFSR